MELLKVYWEKIDQDWIKNVETDIFYNSYDFKRRRHEFIFNIKSKEYFDLNDLDSDFKATENHYYISCESLTRSLEIYINDGGIEEILEDSLEFIQKYLIHMVTPNYSLSELIQRSDVVFTEGEFFLHYEIKSYKTNHPEDPTEYEVVITCNGVLGYDIKLVVDCVNK